MAPRGPQHRRRECRRRGRARAYRRRCAPPRSGRRAPHRAAWTRRTSTRVGQQPAARVRGTPGARRGRRQPATPSHLGEQLQHQRLAVVGLHDLADIGAHQAGHAAHRRQQHELLPHVLRDSSLAAEVELRRGRGGGERGARAAPAPGARGPTIIRCSVFRCRTSPSGVSVAAIWHNPPSTEARPNAASSRSRWRMPFSIGTTIAPCRTAGAIAGDRRLPGRRPCRSAAPRRSARRRPEVIGADRSAPSG